jgi:phosphatidylglycerol---prolipoprotein diacylglyceryl transferase
MGGITIGFDPILAQVGPVSLAWHGVFVALAVAVAGWLGVRLAGRRGVAADQAYTVLTWGIVGGLIGARLFHVADHLAYYADNPLQILAVWEGGIAVYGAFIGGIVGGWLACRRLGLRPWVLLDAAGPAMLVGQAIGRLGCLCNGDAWGAPCGGSCPFCLCVTYVNQHDLLPANLLGVPTYPYPLYEIVGDLAVVAGLWVLRDRFERRPGLLFLAAAVGYAAVRFGLSYFRQEAIVLAGLQEAQVIALASGILAAGLFVLRWQPSRSSAPATS